MSKIAPPCPRCKKGPTSPLARDGDIQRFECVPCSHVFTAPALDLPEAPPVPPPPPGTAHLPIFPPDPKDTPPRPITPPPPAVEIDPATGKVVKARCEKCGRPYSRTGHWFNDHVAKCDGVYVPPPAAQKTPNRAPEGPGEGLPSTFTPTPEMEKAIQISIAALEGRRGALEAEIRGINAAIETLRKLKSGEGLDGPFATGG